MTRSNSPYPTARGVENAIAEAARLATKRDPTIGVHKRVQLEFFNRFLSRIFSAGSHSDWVLKGGAGMLARIPATRSTLDIDLFRQRYALDNALRDLRALASTDLGDHFRFVYTRHTISIVNGSQPYRYGYRVVFTMFIGATEKGQVRVDLSVGGGMSGGVHVALPVQRLSLPRLISKPYRLYPVVDQLADKVCATMAAYDGQPSSREKDLVDIVVLAVTQQIAGSALFLALDAERRLRRMDPFLRFTVPADWGSGYARLSRLIPHCSEFLTVALAAGLASRLIDPVLSKDAEGKMWSPTQLRWE